MAVPQRQQNPYHTHGTDTKFHTVILYRNQTDKHIIALRTRSASFSIRVFTSSSCTPGRRRTKDIYCPHLPIPSIPNDVLGRR